MECRAVDLFRGESIDLACRYLGDGGSSIRHRGTSGRGCVCADFLKGLDEGRAYWWWFLRRRTLAFQ